MSKNDLSSKNSSIKKTPFGTKELNKAKDQFSHYAKLSVLSVDNYSDKISGKMLENYKQLAVSNFWQAVILGSEESVFNLFKYYQQYISDDIKDPEVVALLFGAAEQFSPNECAQIEVKPMIPSDLKEEVVKMVKLIKTAPNDISLMESKDIVFDQIKKFNQTIKLTSGKPIENCFPEQPNLFIALAGEYNDQYIQIVRGSSENKLAFSHSSDNDNNDGVEVAGRDRDDQGSCHSCGIF